MNSTLLRIVYPFQYIYIYCLIGREYMYDNTGPKLTLLLLLFL